MTPADRQTRPPLARGVAARRSRTALSPARSRALPPMERSHPVLLPVHHPFLFSCLPLPFSWGLFDCKKDVGFSTLETAVRSFGRRGLIAHPPDVVCPLPVNA